jgi:hypothetical protein
MSISLRGLYTENFFFDCPRIFGHRVFDMSQQDAAVALFESLRVAFEDEEIA